MTLVAEAPAHNSGRRWTVLGAGILCGLLALVVLYTKPRAFHSPLAVLVLAAIGLAALLLQISLFNRQESVPLRAPKWLNILGIVCALAAVFGDAFGLRAQLRQILALAAILVFSISGAVIMHSLRKRRIESK